MPTPARRPKRSPRRLRKFYAMVVKVFTLARVAKLADARDLKSRVPKGTYRFDSGPGHQETHTSSSTSVELWVLGLTFLVGRRRRIMAEIMADLGAGLFPFLN